MIAPGSNFPVAGRPGCGQWLAIALMSAWLAGVPLVVAPLVNLLAGHPAAVLVQLGLVAPGEALLPAWVAGAIAIVLTLALHLVVFVPVYLAARPPAGEPVRTWAALAAVVAGYLALDALARLPFPADGSALMLRPTLAAALRLAVTLPYLLLVVGAVDARRQGRSLVVAWRANGLRLWRTGSALWLALATAAAAVWPWVVVGSLGSAATTAANALHVLPAALGQEILFRGIALAWLRRAMGGGARNWRPAAGSLLLFVAAQGGMALPGADAGALVSLGTALLVGLLFTELTVRAGGSIWPAMAAHLLYNWFHVTFVDPRSEAEILHYAAAAWAVLALGAAGLVLWTGRRVIGGRQGGDAPSVRRAGTVAAAALAVAGWAVVALLYVAVGAPGFHPDGLMVYLRDQADLGPAAAIADAGERRAWVYQALVDTAERSQATLRADLDRRHVAYRPHYLVNAVEVLERPGLRGLLERQPGVASVLFQPGVRPYPHGVPLPNIDSGGPSGVEWNVHQVGAEQVWADGYTGQGIVVGSADTGVMWDHPALKAAYAGWDGATVDHNYAWYDPWDGRPVPFDDSGHGTHTTGTMVGQDGQNRVGVAPGARWIACRNMRHGIGNAGAYISCMEFLLAPFPLGGDPFRAGDPARGAGVVNNSWGCPTREGCLPETLQIAVDHLRAAGQMMVVSAGNDGPACSTVQDPPALYGSVLSVGAIDRASAPASFTSRGPVTADGSGREKPDISAPGVNIRSAMPGGYGLNSGTSMAGPHVAGVVALLWSARPGLIGDIDRTTEILETTAHPLPVDAAACATGRTRTVLLATQPCPCGADASGAVPNNVFGWGRVDAAEAVQATP